MFLGVDRAFCVFKASARPPSIIGSLGRSEVEEIFLTSWVGGGYEVL